LGSNRLTDGRGVDHVIEVVGGENLNRSLQAVRVSGSICFIGTLAGPSAHINTVAIAMKNVGIHGIYTGSREMFEEMNRFISAHELRPVIDKTYAFAEFPEALKYLESGKQFGKVTVAFSDTEGGHLSSSGGLVRVVSHAEAEPPVAP
jgi:NADPH:quinone reductase-like Zn-dependent oxidoreductase